jgi:hypothetical protein
MAALTDIFLSLFYNDSNSLIDVIHPVIQSQHLPDKTGELRLEVVGGDTSFAGDGVRDRAGLGLLSRKKLKSCQHTENRKKEIRTF